MHYNIGTPNECDQFPSIIINNEEDLKTFDFYRTGTLISFAYIMQTLKEQLEIKQITADQIDELYDAIYAGMHALIADAADGIFES